MPSCGRLLAAEWRERSRGGPAGARRAASTARGVDRAAGAVAARAPGGASVAGDGRQGGPLGLGLDLGGGRRPGVRPAFALLGHDGRDGHVAVQHDLARQARAFGELLRDVSNGQGGHGVLLVDASRRQDGRPVAGRARRYRRPGWTNGGLWHEASSGRLSTPCERRRANDRASDGVRTIRGGAGDGAPRWAPAAVAPSRAPGRPRSRPRRPASAAPATPTSRASPATPPRSTPPRRRPERRAEPARGGTPEAAAPSPPRAR